MKSVKKPIGARPTPDSGSADAASGLKDSAPTFDSNPGHSPIRSDGSNSKSVASRDATSAGKAAQAAEKGARDARGKASRTSAASAKGNAARTSAANAKGNAAQTSVANAKEKTAKAAACAKGKTAKAAEKGANGKIARTGAKNAKAKVAEPSGIKPGANRADSTAKKAKAGKARAKRAKAGPIATDPGLGEKIAEAKAESFEGKDRIIRKIRSDAQSKINSTFEEANKRAQEEIRLAYNDARIYKERNMEESIREREEIIERRMTVAKLEAKKLMLKARKDVIDATFADAIALIKEDKAAYLGLLERMIGFCEDGDVAVIAESDKGFVTKEFVRQAIAKTGAKATVSDEYGKFAGGIALRGTFADKNLTLESELATVRDAREPEISDILFGSDADK